MMKKSDLLASIDVSTRRKRKAATYFAMRLLGKIRAAEQEYLYRIPRKLHGSAEFVATQDAIETLIVAILTLTDAI